MLSLHLPGDDVCHPVASGCSCSLHLRVQGIKADDSVVLNDETGLVDWLNTSSAFEIKRTRESWQDNKACHCLLCCLAWT